MGNITIPKPVLDGTLLMKSVSDDLAFLNNKNWISTTAPSLPYAGQQWYDVTNNILKVWNAGTSNWDALAGSGSSPTYASLTVTGAITVGGNVDGVDISTHDHTGVAGHGVTIAHTSLTAIGTNTHAQIDTHVGSTANPHSVTKTQVSLGNVTDDAQLKRSAGDFATFTAKAIPAGADVMLIEDSADATIKKYCTITQALGSVSPSQVTLTADSSIATTKKFAFDGAGGHSYIVESADNILDVFVGATNYIKVTHASTKIEFLSCDIEVDATKKIYLDGGGNTYISESAGDVISIFTGGTERLRFNGADIGVGATGKIRLDGVACTGDTYIVESGANVLDIYVGNANTIKSSATLVTIPVALTVTGITILSDDVKVAQSKKMILDTDLHTYIWSNGADALEVYVGTVKTIASSATVVTVPVILAVNGDVQITATKKLILDTSAGHSYIVESADGVVDIYAGTVKVISSSATVTTHAVITVLSDDVKITATKKLYLDGGGDTYIVESGANVMDFYTAGNLAMKLDASGRITKPLQPCARAYATQTITNLTWTKINCADNQTACFDVGGNWDNTNYRFTAPVNGYYLVSAYVAMSYPLDASEFVVSALYVNGAEYTRDRFGYTYAHATKAYYEKSVIDIIYMTATQYVELWGYQTNATVGGTREVVGRISVALIQ